MSAFENMLMVIRRRSVFFMRCGTEYFVVEAPRYFNTQSSMTTTGAESIVLDDDDDDESSINLREFLFN